MPSLVDHRPVILVGMHRSGTTLLARLLAQMGVDMGADDANSTCESAALRELNIATLRRARASWFAPSGVRRLLDDPSARIREIDRLRRALERHTFPTSPWGWKDPRTTLTLPLWTAVFPQARVVAVVRNGVDVADSLTRRERDYYRSPWWNRLRMLAHAVYPWHWDEFKAAPFADLAVAFQLWAEYQQFWDDGVGTVPAAQRLVMRYEDLLVDPAGRLRDVARFLQLLISDEELASLAAEVDGARRFAFRGDARLASFYESRRSHPTMVRYGYCLPTALEESTSDAARRRAA
jgi:hypothetical protein